MNLNYNMPMYLRKWIKDHISDQQKTLTQCFSLLLLGMFLATLATLNFSLSLFVGLLATPLSFIGPGFQITGGPETEPSLRKKIASTAVLQLLSPPVVLYIVGLASRSSVLDILAEAAFGWKVNGMWTQVVVWCVWWPAWFVGSVLVWPSLE